MSANAATDDDISLARPVAAEDLRTGDVVAVLSEIGEYPSFLWCCDSALLPPHEPVRIAWRPNSAGMPLTVKAVCLPFVFVNSANGEFHTLDVRQCRLARLDAHYARTVAKALRKKFRKSKSSPL